MTESVQVDHAHQQQMQAAFFTQLPQRWQVHPDPAAPYPMIVGLETEYLLIDADGRLIDEATRDQILAALPHSSSELGTSSIETHTDPVPIAGAAHSLLQEATKIERHAVQAAKQFGARLVRIGAYPGAFSDLYVTQNSPRYQNLMDVSHAMHRVNGELPRVQVGAVTLPELRCETMCGCQSTHLNIQMTNLPRTLHILNKAYELVPYLLALSAHAALLDTTPTGYTEVRSLLWKPLFTFPHFDATHGVNTQRVGLPPAYYPDWDTYWQDVGEKFYSEPDPAHAFAANMKNFWRTVRIKPCPSDIHSCLLEIRSFSPQPTLPEDVALALLLTGLLHDPAWLDRPLLDIGLVGQNLDAASRDGLYAPLAWHTEDGAVVARPATEIAAELLDLGETFWAARAVPEVELLELLRQRLHHPPASPARKSLHLYEQQLAAGHTRAAAAQSVLQAYAVEYAD